MTKFTKYCYGVCIQLVYQCPGSKFTSNRKLQNLNSAAQYIYHTFVVNMYHVLLNIIENFFAISY